MGILDADITGPSIPKMFGLRERACLVGCNLWPAITRRGIKVMSLNLLLDNEEDPVVWRGPLITKAIQQFWEQVLWGKLDYLLIDLPPGTADASLTVVQCIPLDGVVIVASPQELAVMIVKKAIRMVEHINIPILGLIENMSYAVCPKCGERLELFGNSRAEEISASMGITLLGKLPLDSRISQLCDAGEIEKYRDSSFEKVAEHFISGFTPR
ncbi:MAG: Mrp/NBP35 family ATP-binding protein [Actinomycetota bacterium]|nr:Mrp/NBP35 family ATP-binding protein [Actinomycetota bacterium]